MKKIEISRLSVLFSTSLIVIACVFVSGCSFGTREDSQAVTIFKNVSVIDAVYGLRTGQSVIVRGDKIIEAGRVDEVTEHSDAVIIDGTGKFLIPGLWDTHVHLTNSDIYQPTIFPLFIINGITYLRDTSGTLDLILPVRKQAEDALLLNGLAPKVFITGPHIDGLQTSWSSSVSVVSTEQARVITDTLFSAGVDELKIYELLPPEIFFEVMSIANRKNYKVSAHVPLGMDVIEASNAGLGSIEHLNNLELSFSSDVDSLLQARQRMIAEGSDKTGRELREEIHRVQRRHALKTQDKHRRKIVLETLAANNTWQVPTLVITASAENRLYDREDWIRTFRFLPEHTRSAWNARAIEWAAKTPTEFELDHANWAYGVIPDLVESGIGIMAGTDTPLSLLTPGFSLHEELALLVKAGLTPMQAIEAATLRPAQYFGLEHQQGSIAKGMLADLVLLDDNPMEDITNTQRIWAVMNRGHLHTRDKLDKLITQIEDPG